MIVTSPSKLSLAHTPTPLQHLKNISSDIRGPNIWIKRDDWTGSSTSGNKIRKLEYLLADALAKQSDVVITCGGVQSNHCRATAMACAQLGLQCHLILRGEKGEKPEGNEFLDALVGAKISYYPKSKWRELEKIFASHVEEYQSLGKKTYCIPTGGSNALGLWGYVAAVKELNEQFKEQQLSVDYVCCATGSGGTHSGLSLGFYLENSSVNVRAYAVCDDEAYFVEKGREDISSWSRTYHYDLDANDVVLDVCDDYIGEGYALANEQVLNTISYVAQREGIVLDPVYTAKAFMGLLDEIKQGKYEGCENIVFVHTGGIFGLFPFASRFNF